MSAPDVIEITQRLVRTPSTNPGGDESAVADLIQQVLGELGLPAAEVLALDPRRPNLRCTLDFGSGGKHLVLSGHIDTKPVGDADWTVDPWGADLDGDRLYGLGSADMKGAVAAMLVTAAGLVQAPPPAGRLTLLFTADEEDGATYGSHFVSTSGGVEADAVVIGEPSGISADFDRLHLVSRGIARLRLTARGRQGHSSLAGRPGVRNAGVDVARAVVAVAERLELPVPENRDGLADWGVTVNTGLVFRGGVGYGVLPGTTSADTEVRLLPGMTRDAVESAFAALVSEVAADSGSDLAVEFDTPPRDWLPATSVAAGGELARAAISACATVFAHLVPLSVFPGTTDATWFDAIGIPTLPALGPGLLERCHGADEWVSVQAVRQAVDLYAVLARDFCAGGTA